MRSLLLNETDWITIIWTSNLKMVFQLAFNVLHRHKQFLDAGTFRVMLLKAFPMLARHEVAEALQQREALRRQMVLK